MSSNQNKTQSRKMTSIARKLNSKLFWKKVGIKFGADFILVLACLATFMIAFEMAKNNGRPYLNASRLIEVDKDVAKEIKQDKPKGLIRQFDYYAENWEDCNGLFVYRVKDKSKVILMEVPIFSIICMTVAGGLALFVVQLLFCLLGIHGDSKSIKWILKPIDEIALRADELSKMDFDESKYHILEEKITSLSPEESLQVTQNDKDLASIEAAINNLLMRMREANMQQARFVNDASHELRTPIAVIEGYSNMLARWGREDEKVLDESITAIQHESAHMKYLVEQLLFLARGDSGKTELHPEEISLTDMMREIYEESLMIDEEHVYKYNAPEENIIANCDPALLKQAVRILVDNAAKYTAEKDEITISVGKNDQGRPFLQVQDTGIGMAESDVAHMFERFYRSDEVRSYKGTGLGLSIAKWIVDKHKGHFEITSRTEIGTRIRIVL